MINKKKIFIPILVFILSFPSWLQGQQMVKVGVLHVIRAIMESEQGKAAFTALQKQADAKKEELNKQQQELQTLQEQLQRQGATLNNEAKMALSRSLEDKQTILQRATQDAQREFEQRRFDIMARIGPELSKVVEHYANENNFYLILDSSSQNTQVVFNAASLDITMDIIKQFNLSQNSSSNPATGSSLSK